MEIVHAGGLMKEDTWRVFEACWENLKIVKEGRYWKIVKEADNRKLKSYFCNHSPKQYTSIKSLFYFGKGLAPFHSFQR